MSDDYDYQSFRIDILMYPISLVMGITASQFAHNGLVGLGMGLGVKGLANIVFGEVGRRIAKKAPNKIM